ncbi:hypothetical protein GCM10009120_07420 [Sphingobacterium siyangense subsp. cladoniae]
MFCKYRTNIITLPKKINIFFKIHNENPNRVAFYQIDTYFKCSKQSILCSRRLTEPLIFNKSDKDVKIVKISLNTLK